MENDLKCWKPLDGGDADDREILRIGEEAYALFPPTELEIGNGRICLDHLYVERKYKTQVAGLGRVYYDMRSEVQEIPFEELIFREDGICIGVYHDGLVFLIFNEKTYDQKKYLGEMPTGPDQSIEFYDYYYLRFKETSST